MAVNKVEYAGNTLIDLTGDNVTADKLLSGVTAHAASGEAISGSMADNGAVSGTISTRAGSYTVPAGYHNGGGKVQIASAEQAKIIASNIKAGVKILGVTGTLAAGAKIETGTITGGSSKTSLTISHSLGATPNLFVMWRTARLESYYLRATTYVWELADESMTSRYEYCSGGSASSPKFNNGNSAITYSSTAVTVAGTDSGGSNKLNFNGTYNYIIGVV